MLPRVVEQIVWMVKEELRHSGGEMRKAADQYVDTVVSNAVLSVRERLDARQRDASKAFLVASNDPVGHADDNRSNRSWSQQARQLLDNIQRQQNTRTSNQDDDEQDDDDDDYYDDDDDDDDDDVSHMTPVVMMIINLFTRKITPQALDVPLLSM